MSEMMTITPDSTGWLVWAVWLLIGVVGALTVRAVRTRRSSVSFDMIVSVAAAVLGGYLSTQALGDTPLQLFLISVLGAVFFSAAALWFTGWLMKRFSKNL